MTSNHDAYELMHILDTVVSGLTQRLERLTSGQRHRLFGIVCATASELIHDIEPELLQLVKNCYEGATFSNLGIDEAGRIAKWADKRYFDLKEKGVDQLVWENWFKKARLATAIHAAFDQDSWENSADGLYELSVIFDDDSEFLKAFEKGIEAAHQVVPPH